MAKQANTAYAKSTRRKASEQSGPCVVYRPGRTIVVEQNAKTVYPYSTGPLAESPQGVAPKRRHRAMFDERNTPKGQ